MTGSDSHGKAAILIVNGGESAKADRWIQLCLERIAALTEYPNYHIYLWNNRIGDPDLDGWLLARPRLTLLSAAAYETLNHPHRTPLQRLYHVARLDGAHYIVTMDSDAHPLRAGWLTQLLAELDAGAALAGVWRDEMVATTRPYLHPSCLCTTVDFVERHRLRLDFDHIKAVENNDTLSHFTWVAEAEGAQIYRLPRSNQRNFHYLMGGIYGDLIYHHGAASRSRAVFRNDVGVSQGAAGHNRRMRDAAADLLFGDYVQYIGWLRGEDVPPSLAARIDRLSDHADKRTSREWMQAGQRKARETVRQQLAQMPGVYRLVKGMRREYRRLVRPQASTSRQMDTPMHSPFTAGNLEPLPRGWTIRSPDFVGIGAPKSGTTWWYALLVDHPQIVRSRVTRTGLGNKPQHLRSKELQYFMHFRYHDMIAEQIDVYRQAFAAPLGAICGELSTQYLAYPLCIEHLAAAVPETRVVVILRNPIDRFISHLNHLFVNRRRNVATRLDQGQLYVFENQSLYMEAIVHSLYSVGLERLYRHFDPARVLVLQYERSVRHPAQELARSYRFLGVDDRYSPSKIDERVNVHGYAIAKPSPQERANLAAYFAEDVRRTAALCPEIDLALWGDFAV